MISKSVNGLYFPPPFSRETENPMTFLKHYSINESVINSATRSIKQTKQMPHSAFATSATFPLRNRPLCLWQPSRSTAVTEVSILPRSGGRQWTALWIWKATATKCDIICLHSYPDDRHRPSISTKGYTRTTPLPTTAAPFVLYCGHFRNIHQFPSMILFLRIIRWEIITVIVYMSENQNLVYSRRLQNMINT